jgi:hypothetical protein
MTQRTDGGPAFPFTDSASPREYPGMTLRDYFAAQAMDKMIARAEMHQENNGEDWEGMHDYIAEQSYLIADAMLKARES